MPISIACDIDVHSNAEMSVLLSEETPMEPTERARAEILLLSLVAVRMLANAGPRDENAQGLASLLGAMEDVKVLRGLAHDDVIVPLITYPGHRGSMGFDILCAAESDVSFKLNSWGFGVLGGRRLRFYAAQAPLALIRYLALNKPEFTYYEAIGATTGEVSRAFMAGELGIAGQKRVGVRAAELGWAALPREGDFIEHATRVGILQKSTNPPPAWALLQEIRERAEEPHKRLPEIERGDSDEPVVASLDLGIAITGARDEFAATGTISPEGLDSISERLVRLITVCAGARLQEDLMEEVRMSVGACMNTLSILRVEIADPESRTNTDFRFWQ